MNEKIKVNLSKEVYETLLRDSQNFEFFKANKSINRNDFINTLIINYYEEYNNANKLRLEAIKKSLANYHIDNQELALSILNNSEDIQSNKTKLDVSLSFKPTAKSVYIIEYINDYLLNNESLSTYFRNLFNSYTKLPVNHREQILNLNNYKLLNEAIAKHKQIYLKTNKSQYILSPYTIAKSLEELHNYLIAKHDDQIISLRLNRIKHVDILDKETSFDDEDYQVFERMLKYGPQYHYYHHESVVVVEFSDYGLKLYDRLYVHRPLASKIENNRYYFACSHQQILQYLERFGKDVTIIKPLSIKQKLLDFHQAAYNKLKGV